MSDQGLMRIGEVAEELGVSTQTVRRLVDRGELPALHTDGGHRRFRRQDILALKAKQLGEQVESVSRAASFFDDSIASDDAEVGIDLPKGMSFAELAAANPHVARDLLRDLQPRLQQLVTSPGFDVASRMAKQLATEPEFKDAVTRLSKMSAVPELQSAVDRSKEQIAELSKTIGSRDPVGYVTDSLAAAGVGLRDVLATQSLVRHANRNLEQLGFRGGLAEAVAASKRLSQAFSVSPETLNFVATATEQWRRAALDMDLPLTSLTRLYPPVPQEFLTAGFLDNLRATFDAYGPLFENVRRRIERDEATIAAFKEIGWPVAPSMPHDLRQRVVDHVSAGDRRAAVLAILGYYRRNSGAALCEAVEGWSDVPHFAERMPIARDALQAHHMGMYTLSVPAVLPLAEGVMMDVLGESTNDAGKPYTLSQQFVGDADQSFYQTRATAATLIACLLTCTYNKVPFDNERAKPPSRRKANRHTVLHGLTTAYDTEGQSLKAFLLLDAIAALAGAADEEDLPSLLE